MNRENNNRELPSQPWRRRFAWACRIAAALAAVLTVWLRAATDRDWFGTLIAYGPMWVLPAAAGLLFIASLAVRRGYFSAAAAVLICVFPLMGFCFPWHSWLPYQLSHLTRFRLLTCNVEGTAVDMVAFRQLIEETQPDFVTLQECDPDFSAILFSNSESWHFIHEGRLCIASRFPFEEGQAIDRSETVGWGTFGLSVNVQTPNGKLRLANAHLATPRPGIQSFLDGDKESVQQMGAVASTRRLESQRLFGWLAEQGGARVIAGDFNLPCYSTIYRETWSAYDNAFATGGWGWGHTKFTRWHGIRIDHVIYRGGVCRSCQVGPDVGSDHRPIIADLQLAVTNETSSIENNTSRKDSTPVGI